MNPAVSTAVQFASTAISDNMNDVWLYWVADMFAAVLAALLFLVLTRYGVIKFWGDCAPTGCSRCMWEAVL